MLRGDSVRALYDVQTDYLERWVENFTNTVSGLMIDRCIALYFNITRYEPLKVSSYSPLLEKLANKKAIINVENEDNRCLERTLKSALYPASKNAQWAYNYKNYNLNMNGITFPTPLSQIPKVEKQNNIVINVYGYEKGDIVPYYVSRISRMYSPRINLLYLIPPYKFKYVNDVEDYEIDDAVRETEAVGRGD